jgi:hypothetical protein
MPCTSCKKKKVVESTISQNNIMTQNSQFMMRANTGVHQIQFGSGFLISNANMTDALAIEFLKENPNRISLFEVYPENWRFLLNDELQAGPEVENKATDSRNTSNSK